MTLKREDAATPETYTLMPKEIKTAVRWSFRALGIPAGYDRQAAEMVLYAEILYGKGLALLGKMLKNYGAKSAPKPVTLDKNRQPHPLIDAQKEHVLLSMPGIFDFAFAQSKRTRKRFSVEVESVGAGAPLIEQLLVATAQRGTVSAWIPDRGPRWVVSRQTLFFLRPDIKESHPTPTRATLSIGIVPKFKRLDRYQRVSLTEISDKLMAAEKYGIEVATPIWQPVESAARNILVPHKR